jgi:anti-sigma-K factor RskA
MTDDKNLDARELSGAYALDAVTAEEAAEFEQARAASAEVDREAEEFAETASLLGLAAAPVTPSARMKADLMSRIAATPQRTAPQASGAEATRAAAGATPATDAPADALAASAEPEAMAPVRQLPQRHGRAQEVGGAGRARVTRFPRTLRYLAAAAAAVVLFVAGGVVENALTGGPDTRVDQSASALADILAQSDAQRLSQPMGDGTATLVWSGSLRRAAVLVEDLPPLSDDKVYEAWYMDSSGARAAGTFRPSSDAATWHVLDGTMTAGAAVGVTVEPKGGSTQPTSDPVLVMTPV